MIALGNAYRAVEIGFAGAAALLAGLLYIVYSKLHLSVAVTFEPGSGGEVQARLDALDEIA